MTKNQSSGPLPDIVILAGGEGKRMHSGHPKTLQPVFFRPMIHYVLDAAFAIPHRAVCLVVGRDEREMREQCRAYSELLFVRQDAPTGTADAVRAAKAVVDRPDSDVLILNGDTVLLTARSLQALLARHAQSQVGCTVGLAALGSAGPLAYCFRAGDLFTALKQAGPRGAGNEALLEDAIPALEALGVKTAKHIFFDQAEAMDINDQHELWRVESVLRDRLNRELMLGGVAIQDPRTTLIDPRSRIEPGVRIEAGCTVINSVIAAGVLLESHCRIVDSEVGPGSQLRQGTCVEKSRIGRDCLVGPYARLRSGARLDDDIWIGNFVEIENSTIGSGTRAARLSFIGDAQVGRNVTIECGFSTCNSSGKPLKQRTIIEDNVYIGSASQAIAPVTLGMGSFIATGTNVTEDVPAEAFVISRGRQVAKPGYAKKYGKPKGTLTPQ